MVLAWACEPAEEGPASAPGVDVGVDADGGDAGPVLPAPEPPRLADWPCPDGWSPVQAGGKEPWAFDYCTAPTRAEECRGATVQLPGEAECRLLGTECPPAGESFLPEAELRALAPGFDGPILYVDKNAARFGDGRPDAPFRSLEPALVGAGRGEIVTLAPGVYTTHAIVHGDVAIVGSCVAATTLRARALAGGESPFRATLRLGGPGEQLLTNLRLTGVRAGVAIEELAGTATVRQVLVEETAWAGVVVARSGPGALLEEVAIRDVLPADDRVSAGLVVARSAEVTWRGGVVEGTADIGLLAYEPDEEPGPELIVEDVAVAVAGQGVSVSSDCHLQARRVVVEGVKGVGVGVDLGEGPTLELEDLVVRGTRRRGTEPWSAGLSIRSEATVTGRRLLLEDNEDACVWLYGDAHAQPTTVTLEDVVCRGSRAGPGRGCR